MTAALRRLLVLLAVVCGLQPAALRTVIAQGSPRVRGLVQEGAERAPSRSVKTPSYPVPLVRDTSAPPPAVNDRAGGPSAEHPPAGSAPAPALTVPEPGPRIRRYNDDWYALYFGGVFWGFLGLWLVVRLGIGRALSDWAERRSRFRFLQVALFFIVFSLLLALWRLPLGLVGYGLERAYHFATLGPGLWLSDRLTGWLFGLISIPAIWLGYLLLQRSPKRWWLWLWLASIPWSLFTIVLQPVLVDPAYNRFEPLRDAHLRNRLLDLADRAGIHGAKVYQVDISKRTTKLNAYVTGIGPTKRIVIWDTTLRALPEGEIIAIMGHEMGHYVLGHMWWNFGANVVGAFVLLGLLAWILPRAVARFGPKAGIRSVHDLAGLPLAALLLNLLLFLQTPVESAFSRIEEHAADRYGLELTHDNADMARAFITFVTRDYADPNPPPFVVFWLSSHPPLRERVHFALTYRPWEQRRGRAGEGVKG